VSLYYYFLGNLAQAIEWGYKALDILRQENRKDQQSLELYKISLNEMAMGDISKAKETVSRALNLSFEAKNSDRLSVEFARQGYYEFLLGHSGQAYQDFEIALCYEQKRKADEQQLYALEGTYHAEFLIHIQVWQQFEAVNAWNIETCIEYHMNDKLAICHLLQGWYEIRRGKLSQAEEALQQAEHILRPSGMLERICRLEWEWALLAEAREDYQTGLRHVDEALLVCADKGFRLWQAEHFVLRARLYLLQFQKENQADKDLVEKAGDDGDRALKIAEDTGYIWAKVDALKLLAAYHQTRAQLPEFDAEQEKESAQRYAKEADEIEKGLFLTEKQMQELKAQARKEFEKQTAGW
jgi:tetratricopeptide (TPR) repeat protein